MDHSWATGESKNVPMQVSDVQLIRAICSTINGQKNAELFRPRPPQVAFLLVHQATFYTKRWRPDPISPPDQFSRFHRCDTDKCLMNVQGCRIWFSQGWLMWLTSWHAMIITFTRYAAVWSSREVLHNSYSSTHHLVRSIPSQIRQHTSLHTHHADQISRPLTL